MIRLILFLSLGRLLPSLAFRLVRQLLFLSQPVVGLLQLKLLPLLIKLMEELIVNQLPI